MKVAYLDLELQYRSIQSEIDEAIQSVIAQNAFIRGPYVESFERHFAQMHGVKYCLGVGNGTDALFIALKVLGLQPGDEVITVANSFIATSEAITLAGGKVVFADCDSETYCIDIESMQSKITSKTKGIIPVHLYGHPAKMDQIMKIANDNHLFVIEDSAQAVLAEYNNIKIGGFGQFATMSFYPGKNLGAYGDAGALLTNDEALYNKAKRFSNHGRISKYDHEFEGINSRMDGLQGAILDVKLNHLAQWTERRRAVAAQYHQLLKSIESITLPVELPNAKHVYHIYPIRVEASLRDDLLAFLKEHGVEAGVHYPIALPSLQAYGYLNHQEADFPNANQFSKQLISLPIYPELTDEQIKYVTAIITLYFNK